VVPHFSVCPISWNKIPDATEWNGMRSLYFMKRFGDVLKTIFVLSWSMTGKERKCGLAIRMQIPNLL
jgi:hypothetical protein